MKKTIIATTVAALFATTAIPAFAEDGLNLGVNLGSAVSLDSSGLDLGVGTDTDVAVNAGNSGLDANANIGAGVSVNPSLLDDDVEIASDANAGAQLGQTNHDQLAVGANVDASAGINLNDIDSSRVNIVLASSVDAAVLDQSLAVDSDARLVAALDDNVAITSKLDAAGYAASDVLALKGNADGTVLVLIDDLA